MGFTPPPHGHAIGHAIASHHLQPLTLTLHDGPQNVTLHMCSLGSRRMRTDASSLQLLRFLRYPIMMHQKEADGIETTSYTSPRNQLHGRQLRHGCTSTVARNFSFKRRRVDSEALAKLQNIGRDSETRRANITWIAPSRFSYMDTAFQMQR